MFSFGEYVTASCPDLSGVLARLDYFGSVCMPRSGYFESFVRFSFGEYVTESS
jgi:hypothetical protein